MEEDIDLSKLSPEELQAIADGGPEGEAVYEKYRVVQEEDGKIIDAMHPDMNNLKGLLSRWQAKRLASSSKDMADILAKEMPGYDVNVIDERVVIKKPEEKDWHVLDPDKSPEGFGPKVMEGLRDSLDVTWEVGATLPLEVLGGAVGGGLGSVAGPLGGLAMGAGGVGTGSLLSEALRQKIRKSEYGIDSPMDASGALIGTGATFLTGVPGSGGVLTPLAKQGAGKVAKAGRNLMEAVTGVGNSVGGSLAEEGAIKSMLKSIASLVSGRPKKEINYLKENLDLLKEWEKGDIDSVATKKQQEFYGALKTAKEKAWSKMEGALKSANINIDLTGARNFFDEGIAQLEKIPNRVESEDKLLNEFKALRKEFFEQSSELLDEAGNKTTSFVTAVSPERAFRLKRMMDNRLKPMIGKTDVLSAESSRLLSNAKNAVNSSIDTATSQLDATTGKVDPTTGFGPARKEYADILAAEERLEPHFSTPERLYSFLKGLDRASKEDLAKSIKNFDKRFGTNLKKGYDDINLISVYGKPSEDAISFGGVTSTSQTMGGQVLGSSAGENIVDALGGGPIAKRTGRGIGAFLGGKSAGPATLRRGAALSKNPIYQGVTGLGERAKLPAIEALRSPLGFDDLFPPEEDEDMYAPLRNYKP